MDWNEQDNSFQAHDLVTPCVGVWIETPNGKGKTIYKKSHPAWVCGLKHFLISCRSLIFVTPCVGVWIETLGNHPVKCFYKSHPAWVCGLKPIWRRMYHGYWVSHPAWVCGLKRSTSSHINATELSHPAWVCGLKQIGRAWMYHTPRHTLRGCVDWNNHAHFKAYESLVTPCVGVWIETHPVPPPAFPWTSHPAWVCGLKLCIINCNPIIGCHTLRGCVDWNYHRNLFPQFSKVTPCVGVWIETQQRANHPTEPSSHPAWVCGLKP